MLHEDFKPMMAASIQELRRAGVKVDCFGLRDNEHSTSSVSLPCTPHKPLSYPVTILFIIWQAILQSKSSVLTG